MPDKVDLSLDEIVKLNKSSRGGRGGRGGRGRGRGGRAGGGRGGIMARRSGGGLGGAIQKRRSGGAPGARGSPFKAAGTRRLPDGKWLHDMYGGRGGLRGRRGNGGISIGGPTKINISNLDYGVNDKDIKDLFEEFGQIRKAAVHYDRSGRSLGTADVLFEKKQDAIKAVNKYNGVQLDGRPMTIELSGGTGSLGSGSSIRGGASGGPRGRGSGIRRGGRGGGRGGRGGGRQNNNKPAKTQAELDAELDTYSKMQTD